MPTPNIDELKERISCVDAVNSLFWCGGPSHQFDHYYKHGSIDFCSRQIREIELCFKFKYADNKNIRETVKEILKDELITSVGVVWEGRDGK